MVSVTAPSALSADDFSIIPPSVLAFNDGSIRGSRMPLG
jgi:hypothetical protein